VLSPLQDIQNAAAEESLDIKLPPQYNCIDKVRVNAKHLLAQPPGSEAHMWPAPRCLKCAACLAPTQS
jgi:hypothetical protein